MNATIENNDVKKSIADILLEQTDSNDDEFFKGLIQRARYYEQFEARKTKITYSVTQADLEAYS